MSAIETVVSQLVPIMADNIATGELVSRDVLKETNKASYAGMLFYGQRYLASGAKNPAFPLNDPARQTAKILVTGRNFGCGSSWEHAAWALRDYGFRVVIAKSFNDIFYMNAIKNGILPVTLTDEQCDWLAALPVTTEVTVDLPNQTVQAQDRAFQFEILDQWKQRLNQGLTDIDITDNFAADIAAFERKMN